MLDRSLRVRRLVALGSAVAATAIVAPLAAADPAPLFIPHSQQASPRLGEGLSGSDRAWLGTPRESQRARDSLTGDDRSWLAPSPSLKAAVPSDRFEWGDAGIGAATAATVLGIVGGAIAFRRRVSPAH